MNAVGQWWITLGQRMSLSSVISSGISDQRARVNDELQWGEGCVPLGGSVIPSGVKDKCRTVNDEW